MTLLEKANSDIERGNKVCPPPGSYIVILGDAAMDCAREYVKHDIDESCEVKLYATVTNIVSHTDDLPSFYCTFERCRIGGYLIYKSEAPSELRFRVSNTEYRILRLPYICRPYEHWLR